MGQMTADQYLDQIQNQLMKTLTEKKDAMPPGFNQQRFALNCITVIRDMMKDYKKREQLQTVDINSIVLCMIKGAYLGLDFLNGECYAIPYKGEMTFQTDYKGEIKVCKRFSDDPIKDIYAKVVREGDVYDEGVEAGVQKLSFKPVPFSNNVIIAFNKNSKYVQINPGEIAIYNYGVESSKKRAVFDETGNHFYRDGYYVGAIGTNQWSGNNAHKGLVFDLEPQGKYMAFAQKASSSATSYTTMLCFSRANSIYDEYGVNMGCNLIGNWYTLKNFKIGSISAGGYTAFSGAIPIVCEITNNGNSWTYSRLRVYNGIIVGYWN